MFIQILSNQGPEITEYLFFLSDIAKKVNTAFYCSLIKSLRAEEKKYLLYSVVLNIVNIIIADGC